MNNSYIFYTITLGVEKRGWELLLLHGFYLKFNSPA